HDTARVELEHPPCVVLAVVDCLADVRVGIRPTFSGLAHLEGGELITGLSHPVSRPEQNCSAFRYGYATPALRRTSGGQESLFDLGWPAGRGLGYDRIGIGWIHRHERPAGTEA